MLMTNLCPREKMPDCVCNYGFCDFSLSADHSSDLYWRLCCLAMFFNSTLSYIFNMLWRDKVSEKNDDIIKVKASVE